MTMTTMTKHPESVNPSLILSIIQLDHSISQIDRPIAHTATYILDHLSCSTPSEALDALQSSASTPTKITNPCPSSSTLREKVDKSVMRYRRDIDRWTSFASLLMKSLAFYRSLDPPLIGSCMDKKLEIEQKKQLPIVDLPRTKYNRPYLPLLDGKPTSTDKDNEGEVNEDFNSMMNVSHQYPWVCMAQQHLRPTKEKTTQTNNILLGVDVVIFNARLSNYRPTIDEFLESFVGSFTPWEWERINRRQCPSWVPGFGSKRLSTRARSDESKLREFFLRWSMKEAYTKALGLGMNINFQEFETRLLHGVDVDAGENALTEQDEGIWSSIMKEQGIVNGSRGDADGQLLRQFSVVGNVKRTKALTGECWEFIFFPLGRGGVQDSLAQDSMPSQLSGVDASFNACACICRGPLLKNASESSKGNPAAMELLSVVDLVQFHGSNPL